MAGALETVLESTWSEAVNMHLYLATPECGVPVQSLGPRSPGLRCVCGGASSSWVAPVPGRCEVGRGWFELLGKEAGWKKYEMRPPGTWSQL